MGTKIQINSVEALERLIGGDSEIEIEIRNSIAQEFTKKHLKQIVNLELINNASTAILNELKKEIFEYKEVPNKWGVSKSITLKAEFKEQVGHYIKNYYHDLISNHWKDEVDKVNKALKDQVEFISKQCDINRTKELIDNLVHKKLTEKLNSLLK